MYRYKGLPFTTNSVEIRKSSLYLVQQPINSSVTLQLVCCRTRNTFVHGSRQL
uniref:Uncharacterized protein n=1 Tax=Arundo donax TaxID=35708 RepID=A0A0A8YFK4_ARUDO